MNIVQFAQTTSNCTLNGREVPCDELLEDAGGFLAAGAAILVVFFVIGLVLFVFWIMSLIHVLSNDVENKALWIVLLLVLGGLGGVVYFFAVKRPYDKQHKGVAASQQPVGVQAPQAAPIAQPSSQDQNRPPQSPQV